MYRDLLVLAAERGIYYRESLGERRVAPLPVTLAANWLAGAWDQNIALRVMSPVATVLEEVALRWLIELLGLPPESGGGFVTGATMAHFTALAAARHALLERAGWDVEGDGLFGAPPLTVVVGEEAHVSLLKALGLVRLDGLAGADGDAHQCFFVGDDGGRCGALPGGDAARCG